MQTFLPFVSFRGSAEVLDNKRLGKQRVETMQIMQVLCGVKLDSDGEPIRHEPKGWVNHPAVRMWRGHESELMRYQFAVVDEWLSRGFADTCHGKTARIFMERPDLPRIGPTPPWLLDRDFRRSHQSNLVRKDPDHYRKYFPDVPDDLPYIWPV